MEFNRKDFELVKQLINEHYLRGSEYSEFFGPQGDAKIRIFTGFDISEKAILSISKRGTSLRFENCKFSHLEIANSNFADVEFKNCTIGTLTITSTKFASLRIENSTNKTFFKKGPKILGFDKVEIENGCWISAYVIAFKVSHQAETLLTIRVLSHIKKLILIDNSINPKIEITGFIEECEITGARFSLQNAFYVGRLSLKHVDVKNLTGIAESIYIYDCSTQGLTFDKVYCLNDLHVDVHTKATGTSTLNFINCYVGGELTIENCTSDLYFLKEKYELRSLNYNKIVIRKCSGAIEFDSGLGGEYVINSILFNKVSIPADKQFQISGIRCSKLAFDSFKCNSNGVLTDLEYDNWHPWIESIAELIDLYKSTENIEPTVSINQVIDKPTLSIIKSDFGKMNFINVNLSEFTMFFHSSKINEIYLTGSELPREAISLFDASSTEKKFHQEKIAYTQLKKLYEQQGDMVAANAYYANEMNAYYEYLKKLRKEHLEIANLWLNRVSSNHGQSIKQAFLSTVIVSLGCYIIFCICLGYRVDLTFQKESFGNVWTLFAYYFEYLNPVHRLESFAELREDKSIPDSARVADGFSRIFLAYFIYQFIQAFRKYGKSK